jgi:hypothetical protein
MVDFSLSIYSSLIYSALGSVVCIYLAHNVFLFLRKWFLLKAIPTYPAPSRLFGHMQDLSSDFVHRVMREKAKQLGPIYRIRLAHIPVVLVSDPVILLTQ